MLFSLFAPYIAAHFPFIVTNVKEVCIIFPGRPDHRETRSLI